MARSFWQAAIALPILLSTLSPFTSANPLSITKRDNGYGFYTGVGWSSSDVPFITLDNGIQFHFQTSGNIIIYDTTTNPWNAVWSLGIPQQDCTNAQCYLTFQPDGNLVAYRGSSYFFETGTYSFPNHSTAANQLFFSHSYPYISLYSPDDIIMWWTYETGSVVAQNENAFTTPYAATFDPCTLTFPQCRVCYGGCAMPTLWPYVPHSPDDQSDPPWHDLGADHAYVPTEPGSNPPSFPAGPPPSNPGGDPGEPCEDKRGLTGRQLGKRLCAN